MSMTVSYESRAYIHSGGTKYYRLASVSIKNVTPDGVKYIHALMTNYGPFKSEKGDISGHKPVHGGTSSIEYFDNATSLANKLNSESIRRRSRGYDEIMEHRLSGSESEVTELALQEILRGKIGIISAHNTEILKGIGLVPDTTPSTPAMGDVLAKARADVKSKIPSKRGASATTPAAPTPPAPKMPEIDRGEIWGSW